MHADGIYVTRIVDQFQTEMEIGGAGLDRCWFAMAEAGSMLVRQGAVIWVVVGPPKWRSVEAQEQAYSAVTVPHDIWIEAAVL